MLNNFQTSYEISVLLFTYHVIVNADSNTLLIIIVTLKLLWYASSIAVSNKEALSLIEAST